MTGSFSGNTEVQNINSRSIVLINWSRRFLVISKLKNHRPQEPISLVSSYSRNELFFRGTQRIDQSSFTPVNNCTSIECKSKPNSGSNLGRTV